MTKEIFKKAEELQRDIEQLKAIVEESEKESHWIKPITPRMEKRNYYYSVRFQNELTEWLKNKIDEYQKEFDELN